MLLLPKPVSSHGSHVGQYVRHRIVARTGKSLPRRPTFHPSRSCVVFQHRVYAGIIRVSEREPGFDVAGSGSTLVLVQITILTAFARRPPLDTALFSLSQPTASVGLQVPTSHRSIIAGQMFSMCNFEHASVWCQSSHPLFSVVKLFAFSRSCFSVTSV
jgi:hypothetical protein